MKATVKNKCKRYAVLCVGLLIMAFGVAFSIKAGLGTSPISSLPYTLSRITPLSVGTATIAMHVALILLQIILLRRRYDPVQLLQLPVALVFGVLTDFSLWVLQGLVVIACVLGLLFLGHITGVREGTVAAAVLVGLTVKRLSPPIQRWAERHLDG